MGQTPDSLSQGHRDTKARVLGQQKGEGTRTLGICLSERGLPSAFALDLHPRIGGESTTLSFQSPHGRHEQGTKPPVPTEWDVCPGPRQVPAVPGLAEQSGFLLPSTPSTCPGLQRSSLGAWLWTGPNQAAPPSMPPTPVFPQQLPYQGKGKRMLICIFAYLERSQNSGAWWHSSAEGVV